MTPEEEAKELHLNVMAVARRRRDDFREQKEFEDVVEVVDLVGEVAQKAAKWGMKPAAVGRALLFYAKCVAAATEGGVKGIVPAESVDAK